MTHVLEFEKAHVSLASRTDSFMPRDKSNHVAIDSHPKTDGALLELVQLQ